MLTERYRHLRVTLSDVCDHGPMRRKTTKDEGRTINSMVGRCEFDRSRLVMVNRSQIDITFSQSLDPDPSFDYSELRGRLRRI